MPEQKMTYQEKLDRLATEIAKEEFPETFKQPLISTDAEAQFWQLECNHSVDLCRSKAVRSIAAQAEAIKQAVKEVLTEQGLTDRYAVNRAERILLDHGYIEPKTEDDGH